MIEDVRDLSLVEKEKIIARKNLKKYITQAFLPIILSVGIVTLFSIFMFGDFLAAFTMDNVGSTVARFATNLLMFIVLFVGVYQNSKKTKKVTRDFIIVCITIDITYLASVASSVYFNVYALPMLFVSIVIISILGMRFSLLGVAATSILLLANSLFSITSTNINGESVQLDIFVAAIVVSMIVCLASTLFEKRHFNRIRFLINALCLPLIGIPFVVLFTIISEDYSIKILYNVICFYLANIGAVLVYMPIVAIIESMFNIADDFKLSELCSLSNPILKRLASEAPGTFNHSLVVGTLAEACASAIGENPHMARCAAYYHDIGKLKAPIYFSENQSTYNPHDELIPEVSVSMITSHTIFGEILAKQNKLPQEIVAVCREHHGTSPVSYFYRKALTLKEEGELAVEKYTYSGPKPQTKIAAIIMIADTIEAAMRAYMPDTREEYEARINSLIDEKVALRQFDECPITLGDIAIIKKTSIEVLPSIHHSRINYDKKKK